MHVLLTVNAAWNLWNFRVPVIAALLADGHRVTLLAPSDRAVEKLQDMGCQFVDLPMDNTGLNPLRDLGLMRRFKRHFGDLKPDVVLSFTIKNNLYGSLAASRLGIPFIPNVTGLGTAFLSGSILRSIVESLYRFAFAALPCVLFQNIDDLELFVRRRLVSRRQARLVPGSGIDLVRFSAASLRDATNAPTLLMIARLLRNKGVIEFAEASRIVRESRPDVRFLLLGEPDADSPDAVDIATVQGWQATHGVEYLGRCDDVRPHIAQADCIVLPSYREGAPRTLIEAAAMARPVIATDVPGCRAVVEHGINGLLCEPKSPERLAEACLQFLALAREEQEAWGAAGRAKMEREFDQAFVVAAYREALVQIQS